MLCINSFELMLSKPPSTHLERQQQQEGLHQEERAHALVISIHNCCTDLISSAP